MRSTPGRKMAHRRRREQRTDYKARLALVKSGKPRFVIRKSTNNVMCQIVSYEHKGDKTTLSVSMKDLKKLGWKGGVGNIPSAYLTGLLCGTHAKKKGVNEVILDLGLQKSTKGSRLYAALKGMIDAGIAVPHSEDILPPEDRFSGKHIADYANQLKKQNTELYDRAFSQLTKNGLTPENMQQHVAEIKEKVLKAS